ncbi:autotransporter outer membrane beta-barrel domain-containing protein [Enterobacteriaceae bacterium H4N4]|uniref:Autotransporter outer membrane beta-barrel domain-containing protein n=1 Tax=Silvania confinis TaxID=2926470 RepID=A0A9J6QAB4_9ENTR|nr:autotransporter outer membrane beta-barrel domain-containing protein [Silvania confinis]MCU6669479.1 autotransporter outer membrane beta-barrel domain-containing protein [Silvania confinis]
MNKSFRLNQLAVSMSVILGSSLLLTPALANTCAETLYTGTCGLKENATLWSFTKATQDGAIDSTAKAQNIYFSGPSRSDSDTQQILVDGANLSNYFINVSKGGTANVEMVNHAALDVIEGGNSKAQTNTHIVVDASTLNGATKGRHYDVDKAATAKDYLAGYAIYLDVADNGNADIDIQNNSLINGRILAGGAGTHDISVQDSRIQAGGILLSMTKNDNAIAIQNSVIDSTGNVAKSANAIEISNLVALPDKTQAIVVHRSQLTGSVTLASSGSTNTLSVSDSTVTKTTLKDGSAISMTNGKTTELTLSNSQIVGHVTLSGAATGTLTASLTDTHLTGNLIANKAAQIAMDITRSVLEGSINATTGAGTVDLHLTDSSLSGDVDLKGTPLLRSDVWLDNTAVAGYLYGSGNASTLHLANMPVFGGTQFSNFDTLTSAGDLLLTDGFSDANVGNALTVTGTTVTAPVQLSSGKLIFDDTKLIADTLALSSGASLNMVNHSQLQTRSDQLFNQAASSLLPEGYNETGAGMGFTDSTLILTDDSYHLDYVKAVNSLLATTAGNSLVMLGTLENADNVAGTASVIDAAMTQAVLANTLVTSSKNQLNIGEKNAITDETIFVQNGFGASQLRFEGEGQPSVDISGGQSLTLTGAAGALIDVAGAADTPVAVAVNNGTLNLGTAAMQNVTGHLTGTVTVSPDGTLNIVAGDHTLVSGGTTAGVISSGRVNVDQQATLHADVALQDNAQMSVNGSLQAGQLTASEGAQITVGNGSAAGLLTAERLDLQGGRMFIDPAWTDGGTLANASRVASGGNEINGRVTVGQNALLVLGDTSTAAAEARFADSGFIWGENAITAAVSVHTPQYLSATQGGLRVDGSLTGSSPDRDAAFNTAEFADHSLLMVNSKEMTNGLAALNATNGSLKVADSAALYVADAKANQTYAVAKGFSDVNIVGNGWQNDNLQLNKLLTATTEERDGEVVVTTQARSAQEVLPGVVTTHALDQLIASGDNSRTASQAGARYLSVAIDTPQVGVNEVVRTINSAAQIATAGGVQRNTWAAGNAAVDAVLERNSIANAALQPADTDASVWVHALYGNPHTSDLSAGNLRYGQSSDFYGLMLGGDKAWQTERGTLRSGAAFHAGNGDSDSRGDVNATHNDFSFWGITLYQNWNQDRWNLTGDISLTQTSSDLGQKQPGWMAAGDKLRANVDSTLFSVGVRGEYLIETGVMDVIPHAGVRYNQLSTDGFDTKNGQHERVFHTDKGTQDIWQFPVGVKVAKTFALDSGWKMSTQADVGVVAVTGDRDSQNTLHTVGISSSDTLGAQILDDTSFNGRLGVKMQKGNMTVGVGYNVNASQHDTDQIVSATWALAF